MLSDAVSLFVIVFTALNILACLWLLWWTGRTPGNGGSPDAVEHSASADAQLPAGGIAKTGHVWDGDLQEYNNPLPRWWLGLFVGTVLFGAAYLVFYPGLGNFAGVGAWTSIKEYQAQADRQQAQFEASLAGLHDKDLHELGNDRRAMSIAQNLFAANCSTCHGSDGRGAKGFPNLADSDWLWGGDAATVQESVANGRHAVMPALGAVLGRDGVNEVASYAFSLSGGKAPPDWVAAGKERFTAVCAACHGADARGNASIGAPNLTDNVWLFGGDFDAIRATIVDGRDSQMPAHTPLLGESKVRLLAAYVLQLSANPATLADDRPVDAAPVKVAAGSSNERTP